MTKYEKLKNTKNNFIQAAAQAEDPNMSKFWQKRAEQTQKQIDKLTVESANMEIKQ